MISNDTVRPPDLHMTRVFDAPRALVFEAWTKAEHVAKWFAPAPLTIPSCELDFRPGGRFHLVMRATDGTEFPMDTVFREIVANERIVFEGPIHGGVLVTTTVTFTEQDGKTRLDAHQTYSKASDATRGAQAGWTATLDQLGRFVAPKS